MKVVYSPRAIRDLENIATYYRSVADPRIAAAISDRIEHVINASDAGRKPRRESSSGVTSMRCWVLR